jgi:hypothetical protein
MVLGPGGKSLNGVVALDWCQIGPDEMQHAMISGMIVGSAAQGAWDAKAPTTATKRCPRLVQPQVTELKSLSKCMIGDGQS